MKERPIIFCGEMVKVILKGRKTQTRRIINPQPIITKQHNLLWKNWNWGDIPMGMYNITGLCEKCPYGQVGDRLWVRENIRTSCYPYQDGKFSYGGYLIEYIADKKLVKCPEEYEEWWRHNWHIRPSTAIPSIHMPRWASRITLEITNIRVERVQDISLDDILAEGIEYDSREGRGHLREKYQNLWDSLNAKRGYSWESNPWVWVIEFRKEKK